MDLCWPSWISVGIDNLVYKDPASMIASSNPSRGVGSIWLAGSYQYIELDSEASTYHLITSGGVKLNVLPKNGEVHLAAWNVAVDGTGDASTQIAEAVELIRSLGSSPSWTGFRIKFPALVLPVGEVRFTVAESLNAAFITASQGYVIKGVGRESTTMFYDNDSGDPALDTSVINSVKFQDLTIRQDSVTSRFIRHFNAGSGGGSFLVFQHVRFVGDFEYFVEVEGTSLGSETIWYDVAGGVPVGGTLLRVNSTNPQSVNHQFVNCTIGTRGTVFHFSAGRNLRWFGGYTSMYDDSTFLLLDPPSGGLIGVSNSDFSFFGWHPEIVSGNDGDVTIVKSQAEGDVSFILNLQGIPCL